MAEPKRVRVQGDLFHGVIPEGAIYVGRGAPGLPASPYRNPYRVRELGAYGAVAAYVTYLRSRPDLVEVMRRELAGRDLACWCRLSDLWCHADVNLRVVAGGEP